MRLKQLASPLIRQLRVFQQVAVNRRDVNRAAQNSLLFFQTELQQLLGCDSLWLKDTFLEYCACPAAWQYLSGWRSPSRRQDGFAKSLDIAEGFAVWALVKYKRPKTVVELGVQYGISARLWKEALKAYVPDHQLILCDLEDNRRFVSDKEVTFFKGDARQTLPTIFASQQVDLLHNDAHPYDLIGWSLLEALRFNVPILTFHDVGGSHHRGSFKRDSARLTVEERKANNVAWGQYGHWERHVMAEVFGDEILDTNTVLESKHQIQIFDSLFGFGVVLTKDQKSRE